MSAEKPAPLTTRSPEQTRRLGLRLGGLLREGDFVALAGQLGAGKTLFAKAVAEGAGIEGSEVSSPTFSIVQSYRGRLLLHHADLYRLASSDELVSTGFFDLEPGATLVEWAENVPSAVPDEALRVTLTVLGDEERQIEVSATGVRHQALLAAWLVAIDAV